MSADWWDGGTHGGGRESYMGSRLSCFALFFVIKLLNQRVGITEMLEWTAEWAYRYELVKVV